MHGRVNGASKLPGTTMKLNRIKLIAAAAVAGVSMPLFAQDIAFDRGTQQLAQASAPATDLTYGEVRKVNSENGKVTLRHGEIRNLGMPGMTMAFRVSDPKFLDGLRSGDKVKFRAENVNGALTVTAIEPAK